MRTLFALLFVSTMAIAADGPHRVAIAIEPLGDRGQDVVTKVSFTFANPSRVTQAGLFLEGSLRQEGHVARNFRIAVPRKDDKGAWFDTLATSTRVIREYRWVSFPDQRNEVSMLHTFSAGAAEIEARLVLERDYGAAPMLIADAIETFTIAKTNKAFAEEPVEEEPPAPEPTGAVTIREAGPTLAPNVYRFHVDVLPPVKRVEFWVGEKKIVARNAPPYVAELELGDVPEPVVRAIGYAAGGRYVDADAFVVKANETPLTVAISRTATADGFTHLKVSVRAKGVRVKSVALYAGEKKLHEWAQAPYTLSVTTASLAGAGPLRAVVIDDSGREVSDLVSR